MRRGAATAAGCDAALRAIAAAAAILCVVVSPAAAATKLNGLNYLNGQWSAPKYDSDDAAASLRALQTQTGANWVALTYCWFQPTVDTPGPVAAGASSPTAEQLGAIVAQAHKLGVRVLFRPCVDPDWSNPKTKGTWRGMIGRGFSAAQWDTWFESYGAFMAAQAELAQRLHVDMFAVGLELIEASHQTAHFQGVVKSVRAAYAGNITYCANHGNEDSVEFWGDVDLISIDAYYPLAPSNPSPTVADMVAAWQPIAAGLQQLSTKHGGKDIFFAEIGYCSSSGTNVDPAHCYQSGDLDLQAQVNAFTATFEALYPLDWFAGLFWWDWATDPADGGPTGKGFSPRGKPAAATCKTYFGKYA